MNNKIIIATTTFFLLISFVTLSLIERNQADINTKNVWMLYFENPKDNSLNFVIENHSNSDNFHWKILSDKDVVKESDAIVANGSIKTIPLSITDTQNKKMTISVTSNNNTKEIYKSF